MPLSPLLKFLFHAVSIAHLELDDRLLGGTRRERPIVRVRVPNELIVPMALKRFVATVVYCGQ